MLQQISFVEQNGIWSIKICWTKSVKPKKLNKQNQDLFTSRLLTESVEQNLFTCWTNLFNKLDLLNKLESVEQILFNKLDLFNKSGLLNKRSVRLLNLLNKICSTDWIWSIKICWGGGINTYATMEPSIDRLKRDDSTFHRTCLSTEASARSN